MTDAARLLDALKEVVGSGLASGADIEARHLGDWMVQAEPGVRPLAVVSPRSTEEVAAILRLAHAARVPVVPQGGLSGLAGGGTPVDGCIALSFDRMRAIEDLDPATGTITVQAGVPLQRIQEAAADAGFFYGVDLGGRGSCQAGGNIATNAGGNRVLRYGMTREQVVGLEVVLADGTILSSLGKMLKNNAGYDLKQLFIGSEGTLGVITRAVLRLRAQPVSQCVALLGLADYAQVLQLLTAARAQLGDTLSAFEMMSPEFYALGTTALQRRPPLDPVHGLYVLIELLGTDQTADEARLFALVEQALEAGIAENAVAARSQREVQALWGIRDCPGEWSQTWFWPQISFDLSIATGRIGDFMPAARARILAAYPTAHPVFFGHVADSNLHLSVRVPEVDPQPVHAMDSLVYDVVRDWHGSVSAEHGIGLLKREFLEYSRSPAEIAVMRTLKAALDPRGILNPGKVIPDP
jgi:FAD/FMN-containing dehydrogenase